MKITAVTTIQLGEFPNVIWVELETDSGIVGLGETFRGADVVAAQLHSMVAPYLLGKDPLEIDRHSRALLNPIVGFAGTGAEMRAASAVDLALWDIYGKQTGLPVYQLLGGLSRDRIRVYNTCSGYNYNNRNQSKREITKGTEIEPEGPYEDQFAFVNHADRLAESLLAEGYTAMKIWPFDPFAVRSGGLFISGAEIKAGLEPFEKIRRAVGDAMDVMCELHSLWNYPCALQIAHALEQYRPYWAEDPIRMTDVKTLRAYAEATTIPVCASETLSTRGAFRELLEAQAVSIVMLDLGWCGGLSEARKIAALAEAYQRPIAPHDCTGPVVLAASIQLALNAPNALFQEVVRAFLAGWYKDVVCDLPRVAQGFAYPSDAPGLGVALQPALKQRSDAVVRRTTLE
jgi:L-alanine-DL-glutamate epimerase-like enolase superfamily enzyme